MLLVQLQRQRCPCFDLQNLGRLYIQHVQYKTKRCGHTWAHQRRSRRPRQPRRLVLDGRDHLCTRRPCIYGVPLGFVRRSISSSMVMAGHGAKAAVTQHRRHASSCALRQSDRRRHLGHAVWKQPQRPQPNCSSSCHRADHRRPAHSQAMCSKMRTHQRQQQRQACSTLSACRHRSSAVRRCGRRPIRSSKPQHNRRPISNSSSRMRTCRHTLCCSTPWHNRHQRQQQRQGCSMLSARRHRSSAVCRSGRQPIRSSGSVHTRCQTLRSKPRHNRRPTRNSSSSRMRTCRHTLCYSTPRHNR